MQFARVTVPVIMDETIMSMRHMHDHGPMFPRGYPYELVLHKSSGLGICMHMRTCRLFCQPAYAWSQSSGIAAPSC